MQITHAPMCERYLSACMFLSLDRFRKHEVAIIYGYTVTVTNLFFILSVHLVFRGRNK